MWSSGRTRPECQPSLVARRPVGSTAPPRGTEPQPVDLRPPLGGPPLLFTPGRGARGVCRWRATSSGQQHALRGGVSCHCGGGEFLPLPAVHSSPPGTRARPAGLRGAGRGGAGVQVRQRTETHWLYVQTFIIVCVTYRVNNPKYV